VVLPIAIAKSAAPTTTNGIPAKVIPFKRRTIGIFKLAITFEAFRNMMVSVATRRDK
jgi:hypothetical protein